MELAKLTLLIQKSSLELTIAAVDSIVLPGAAIATHFTGNIQQTVAR